jgi:signal transduction histidine kinase
VLARLRESIRHRIGGEFLVVFVLTILLPGVLLAVFGVRALLQERRAATEQLREHLDVAADTAVRDLIREVDGWQTELEQLTRGDLAQINNTQLSPRLRALAADPDAGVIAVVGPQGVTYWPEKRLLYALDSPPESVSASSSELAAAESIEIRDKDYPRASALYSRLLASAAPTDRTDVLLRLARTYRHSGREDDALRIYRELEGVSSSVDGLPATLIAEYEVSEPWAAARLARDAQVDAALRAYRRLVEGDWTVDQASYAFYATGLRDRLIELHAPVEELQRLGELERRKRALTEAAVEVRVILESTVSGSGRPPVAFQTRDLAHVALTTPAADSRVRGAALVATEWFSKSVLPKTFGSALAQALDVQLQAGPYELSVSVDGHASTATLVSTREASDLNPSWRLRVWSHDPNALTADVAKRQAWFVALLALVVMSLVFGASLTVRVVRKESEIARLKSEFVSTVSHEFRSPLTGIRQLGEMLMRGRVPDEHRRQEYYERITKESERLARLVENLLDFSRMEDGRHEHRRESIDAATWLRDVVAECQSRCADKPLSVAATIPADLPLISGDRDALSSAVQNLLDNAIKYSPGRQTVWLDAWTDAGGLRIAVRDEGVGIPEADRRRIFEKFRRGSGEISREVKGAGIGLNLVEHIVRAHGGQVIVESEPGRGSTFTIALPIAIQG